MEKVHDHSLARIIAILSVLAVMLCAAKSCDRLGDVRGKEYITLERTIER